MTEGEKPVPKLTIAEKMDNSWYLCEICPAEYPQWQRACVCGGEKCLQFQYAGDFSNLSPDERERITEVLQKAGL